MTRTDQPGASWGPADSKDSAPDDPSLLAKLRKLQMACGEFVAIGRAS
jgi:hypothetical protein